ncbi:MAG: segregation/condensation protein A [Candidatus Niyogibacteria bacterium]|nr:MAG: segregation/condensation protein A [Candidatus Niyogibacteria bacterium]
MAYKVKTEKFEGPFDALLDLIEEKKLSISEISLAQVCEDYLKHFKTLGDISRSEAASFLAVGATLMLIKSRTLLPALELTPEEEESIEELENRLKLLRKFRSLARNIHEYGARNTPLFSREAFSGHEFGFLPPEKVTISLLQKLAGRIIDTLPKTDLLLERTLVKVITIEEKTRELMGRIQNRLSGSLEKIISAKDKIELIVGFLALLELIKQGIFEIEQKSPFGEVELKKAPV